MADRFGAASIPAAQPTFDGVPVNDPALFYLGTFLRDVANYECSDSWKVLAPEAYAGANDGPIRHVYAADPGEVRDGLPIDEGTLPSLFLYRDAAPTIELYANGLVRHVWDVHAVWIVPAVASEGLSPMDAPGVVDGAAERRHPFWPSIVSAWTSALFAGYHPAWKVAGDTGQDAQTIGSALVKYMQYHTLLPKSVKRTLIQVEPLEPLAPGEKLPSFEGYDYTITLSEMLKRDPLRRARPLQGLNATVTSERANPQGQPVLGPATVEQLDKD